MTTFTCPHGCGKTLEMTDSISVTPKSSLSQDELIQTYHCNTCHITCLGLYKESSAGAEESINHDGYILERSSYDTLKKLIEEAYTDKSKLKELEKIYHAGFTNSKITVDWRSIFPIT